MALRESVWTPFTLRCVLCNESHYTVSVLIFWELESSLRNKIRSFELVDTFMASSCPPSPRRSAFLSPIERSAFIVEAKEHLENESICDNFMHISGEYPPVR